MQIIIVSLCIVVAVAFMGRKFYRAVKKSATCCGGSTGATPKCEGCASACSCQSQNPLQELTPKK